MKLQLAAIAVSASSAASAASASSADPSSAFRPLKIEYRDLVRPSSAGGDHSALMGALSSVGMVSVTGLPRSFRGDRDAVRSSLGGCAAASPAARAHEFEDGTRRTTLASHTVPGPGGIQTIRHNSDGPAPAECAAFDAANKSFRARIDEATRAFAARISEGLATGGERPPSLLQTKDGHTFDTVYDVVDGGEHLEHFHDYRRGSADAPSSPPEDGTVEWHTDQGLLLAFTPGVRVHKDGRVEKEPDDSFSIQLADGTKKLVQFDEGDELVFMLGDGVDQAINPSLEKAGGGRRLRAVPHALSVHARADGSSRVWYGRMVLPPSSAVHPRHGETFGRLRDLLAENADGGDSEVHALGCSWDSLARQLEEAQCEPGSTFCWHRCMLHEDYGVSVDMCAENGLDLRCMNPRHQLYTGGHGDWYPGCIDADTASNYTEYDPLPNFPREETCTAEAHDAFVLENVREYEHHKRLPFGGTFYWTVEDGGVVSGMLSYDGLFGYISYGWAGVGARNEMQQAHVVMAHPSSVYSARYGYDFDYEPAVHLHWIGDQLSLRHWQEPLAVPGEHFDPAAHEVVEGDCFTSLKFRAAGIHDRAFNLTGTDRLMWAANGEDMYGGYHGLARAVFTVDWMGGTLEYKCSMSHGKNSCTGLYETADDEETKDTADKEDEDEEDTEETTEEEGLSKEETEETAELETGEGPLIESDAQEGQGGVKDPETEFVGEREKTESAAGILSLLAPLVVGIAGVFFLA